LGTAFFVTYSFFQIVAGWLNDRFNVNWVYAVGFLAWSAATALTGFARDLHFGSFVLDSFGFIFILRLVLGISESIAYPAYSKIITGCFPEGLRGTANAAIDAGSKVGPALGVIIGVILVNRFDWRGMFFIIGGVSLVWLIPWCFVAPRLTLRQQTSAIVAPSYLEILSKRPFWGAAIGLFGANYMWYFLLTWTPYYFERYRHFSQGALALVSSLPLWGIAAASMAAGLLADKLIRQGRVAARVRQSTVCIGLVGCCLFTLPGVLIQDQQASVALITLAAVWLGGFSSNHWALAQTLSGPEAAGRWTALQNCVGNFAGIAAAWITGVVLNYTHSFVMAFVVCCGMMMLSLIGYWFIIGNETRVRWASEQAPAGILSA
jgi:MFS family permease